jgi:hypothetical protein
MREILYRAKTTGMQEYFEKQEWVYGFLTRSANAPGERAILKYNWVIEIEEQGNYSLHTKPFIVDPETVGQFTCLTDKNGVRIFEGDIVRKSQADTPPILESNALGIVTFGEIPEDWGNHQNIGWFIEWKTGYDLPFLSGGLKWYTTHSNYSIEVVGNIHDDPELLGLPANKGEAA